MEQQPGTFNSEYSIRNFQHAMLTILATHFCRTHTITLLLRFTHYIACNYNIFSLGYQIHHVHYCCHVRVLLVQSRQGILKNQLSKFSEVLESKICFSGKQDVHSKLRYIRDVPDVMNVCGLSKAVKESTVDFGYKGPLGTGSNNPLYPNVPYN